VLQVLPRTENNGNTPNLSQDVASSESVTAITSVTVLGTQVEKDNTFLEVVNGNNVSEPSQDVASNTGSQDISPEIEKDLSVTDDEKHGNSNSAKNDGNSGNTFGKLSEKLNEYLSDCPESFQKFITVKLKENKLPISRAVEASRRMVNKDTVGAWQVLKI
jgi:hypothetical protein